MAHPLLKHPNGDYCIWLDGVGWFVPYDVAGDGVDCPHEHPFTIASPKTRPDWDEYFLLIAKAVSTRGECVRSQVGAVLVRDKRIVATGYNGVAAGERSCLDGACPRGNSGLPRSSEGGPGYAENPCIARHAEDNAISDAIYRGLEVWNSTIYLTKEPCNRCQLLLDSYNLRVVWQDDTRS